MSSCLETILHMFWPIGYLRSYLKFLRSYGTFPETEREILSDTIQHKASLNMQYYSGYQWIPEKGSKLGYCIGNISLQFLNP